MYFVEEDDRRNVASPVISVRGLREIVSQLDDGEAVGVFTPGILNVMDPATGLTTGVIDIGKEEFTRWGRGLYGSLEPPSQLE